jgi:GTP cyclohydrolase I
VVLRDIVFHSMCVHHLLPFFGRAHVAYIPSRRLVGLSKVARVVDILARRLQVQERLTDGVVETLVRALRPAGAACIIEAEHMCVACRGVRKHGVRILTSRFAGRLARGPMRNEALRLLCPPPQDPPPPPPPRRARRNR